jgi:signal transduction histidine kinase
MTDIRDILRARVRRGVDLAILIASTLGSAVALYDLAAGSSHEPTIAVIGLLSIAACSLLGLLGRAQWMPIAYVVLIMMVNAVYLASVGVWFGLGTVYVLGVALAFVFISPRGAWIVGIVFAATPLALGVLFEVGLLPDRPALLVSDANDWRRAAFGSIGGLVGIGVVASYAVGLLIRERTKLEDARVAQRAQRLERERVDAEIARVRRVEAIAELAAEVGGEIGAAIEVVKQRGAALATELKEGDAAECLADIAEATSNAAATMRSLTILAPDAKLGARGNVRDAVGALTKLLRRMIPARISLRVAADDESFVGIGTSDLTRICANLALNARDAIEGAGTIVVSAERAGDEVVLEVRDTGSGMPADVLARLFQPFFTTKAVGRGTGLGLATAKILVEHAGGTIGVVSAVGQGTTFSVRLPRL